MRAVLNQESEAREMPVSSQRHTNSDEPAWFARIGLPLGVRERAGIAAMLRELDYGPGMPVVGVASWVDVAHVLRAEEWDNRWWDAEEEERERLWSLAALRLTEDELLRRLTAATDTLADSICNGAALAAGRGSVAGSGLQRAAVDAALLAAHQRALADVAGVAAEHYFRRKFELFADGRWPLGVHSGEYLLF